MICKFYNELLLKVHPTSENSGHSLAKKSYGVELEVGFMMAFEFSSDK